MTRELLLWGACLICGVGSVIFLRPETFWQRFASIPIFIIGFLLPVGLYVAALYFKPNEKDK